jgi:3-deoxy-D-manno-octulosonic-acid transferase
MSRLLYSLAVYLLLPLAPLYLLRRGRRQPEYRQHWRDRFGCYPATKAAPQTPTYWIHAVSVGETRAAQPVVRALLAEYPQARIVMTHMTPTGRATAAELYGERIASLYLPYDTPGGVRRFLDHVRPQAGIVMETELWPNLLHACAHRGIPVMLANARLSARSAAGYARFGQLSAHTLNCLAAIGAQSEDDAARLRALGARDVVVTGSVKFDIAAPDAMIDRGAVLRQRWSGRRTLLCASTREGEEALILDAWKVGVGEAAISGSRPLLILVPRHPQRFDEVAALIEARGLRWQRRSEDRGIDSESEVVLGDSMGELFAYYAASDVAFIGGSLLDYGCQNLIEACAVGTPVLLGPSTFNFAEAAREALACGAARHVSDAASLITTSFGLLADSAARHVMGAAGRDFAAAHRGATARTLDLLRPLLDATLSPAAR